MAIGIIILSIFLNDDVVYLWDRNVIPISDEGNDFHVYFIENGSITSCQNDMMCYPDTADIWFNPGGQVAFHNNDTVEHTVTSFPINDNSE